MNAIKGIYKNGHIVLESPADWPDGTEVIVEAVPRAETLDMNEEQGEDPESISRWLAEFEAIPPLKMTPEEEAKWQAARKAQKEFEISAFNERAEKLRGMWE